MSFQGGSSKGRSSSSHTITAHGPQRGRTVSRSREADRPRTGVPSSGSSRAVKSAPGGKGWRADAKRDPDPILFQTYFKSVGPRTYAAQLKRAANNNHYLVFTEGKRDKVTDEVRKISLYVYSEDFVSFFKMLKETAEFVRAHPLPAEVAKKRARYWQREKGKAASADRAQ